MTNVSLRMIVPLETAGADLGASFAFGGFRCEATGRSFYCGQAFPRSRLETPGWRGQVHCPFCKDFHDMTRSEETTRLATIPAEVSEERDGRRTVSFRLRRCRRSPRARPRITSAAGRFGLQAPGETSPAGRFPSSGIQFPQTVSTDITATESV